MPSKEKETATTDERMNFTDEDIDRITIVKYEDLSKEEQEAYDTTE